MGDGGGVGFFEEAAEDRLRFADEIAHLDADGGTGDLPCGVGEATRRAVMTVAKRRGEDQQPSRREGRAWLGIRHGEDDGMVAGS